MKTRFVYFTNAVPLVVNSRTVFTFHPPYQEAFYGMGPKTITTQALQHW